jgi:hypothetical protein
MWDDFTELTPGAVSRLRDKLDVSQDQEDSSSSRSNSMSSITKVFSDGVQSVRSILTSSSENGLEAGLPLHERSSSNSTLENGDLSSEMPHAAPMELLWLLLCYSQGRYATRLLQLELISQNAKSDRRLFEIMRDNYCTMRGKWTSHFSLRTLRSIKFVQFQMYGREFVSVRRQDVVPPPQDTEYRYKPAPLDFIPPVGENQLLHCFHNPDHAGDEPFCLDRFPKKLKDKLKLTKDVGWGLQFVEGWNVKKLWIVVFVFFGLGSLLIGIFWAYFKHSIQDAFSIAAYMVAFATVSVGTVQALLVM